MIKKLSRFLLCLCSFTCIFIYASAQLNVEAIRGLLSRVIPEKANCFEVSYIPQENNQDVFEVESTGDKIILRGNNGVSVASALNYYLRHYCHCLITWNGTNLKLPDDLPDVPQKIHKKSPHRYRYYLNYVTFSYSMVWWDWDRWQREIDWMALNGINMPLAIIGQNAIWKKVYEHMGYSDEELTGFFSGPAFLPFFWMNLLDGWGGPLPQKWIDSHETLQHKILKYERSLGMRPVLPAFTGHVPPDFKKKFPQADINQVRWGSNFDAVNVLSPDDSLFSVIGKKFLEEQIKEYGTDHIYTADVFNEITPPSNDSIYLNNVAKKVFESMHAADSNAVWVMQGWLFHFDSAFWHTKQIKALLNAVPDQNMIILDLWSESHPVWNRTDAYYGKPWIWNMLHNFGERIYLGGCLPCIINQPASLVNNPKAGNLMGIGMTMEGIKQNPIVYQLMMDNTWRSTPIDLDKWVKNYVYQRYGVLNKDAIRAWRLLQHSVYLVAPSGYGSQESVITQRPELINLKEKPAFNYSFDSLFLSWKFLLNAAGTLEHNAGYQYDLVNTGRQVLADYAVLLLNDVSDAYRTRDIKRFGNLSKDFIRLIDDIDLLLSTNENFLLGKWLNNAKRWGQTREEKHLYEFNARNLITLWGNKTSSLHDYGRKQWSGMLKGFYKKRWKMFFDYALNGLKNNNPLNMRTFNKKIEDWEWKWDHNHDDYPGKPTHDPVRISKNLYKKYTHAINSQL